MLINNRVGVFYYLRDTNNRKSVLGMKVCPVQVIVEGGGGILA